MTQWYNEETDEITFEGVTLNHTTADAYLVQFDVTGPGVWIAKTQCKLDLCDGNADAYDITLPEWLAKDRELI